MFKAHYHRGLPGRALAQGSLTGWGLSICNWGMEGKKKNQQVLPLCTCIRELFSWFEAKPWKSFPSVGNGKIFEYGGSSCREEWHSSYGAERGIWWISSSGSSRPVSPQGQESVMYFWCTFFLSGTLWESGSSIRGTKNKSYVGAVLLTCAIFGYMTMTSIRVSCLLSNKKNAVFLKELIGFFFFYIMLWLKKWIQPAAAA